MLQKLVIRSSHTDGIDLGVEVHLAVKGNACTIDKRSKYCTLALQIDVLLKFCYDLHI